jgi:hypothetical protein
MKGVFGRYLWVDLSSGKIREKEIPERWYELFLGGRGLAARLFLEHVSPGTDPFFAGERPRFRHRAFSRDRPCRRRKTRGDGHFSENAVHCRFLCGRVFRA